MATTPHAPQILVVDDSPMVQLLLATVLPRHGFAVSSAVTGAEAIDLYRRGGIDLVLLDVQLPEMDGPHTFAVLWQLNPALRCCFMSGDPGDYAVEELLAAGALAFLHKPFDNLDAVARTLHGLVGERVSSVELHGGRGRRYVMPGGGPAQSA